MGLRKIADYTIIREVGRGGMGVVFQALSPTGVTVAIKTVTWPEPADARRRWEAIERFQREARAARALTHPNVCQVLDCGVDQDSFFIVMEFLDGQTVEGLISLAGAIKPERAVDIVLSVGEALGHAHKRGIVHRDVKPGNIVLLHSGEAKLTDFGLAALVFEATFTRPSAMVGTLCYMSPEQVRGEPVDPRSDIFSLGATLYEMLTGTRAFGAADHAAVIHRILEQDPPPLTGLPVQIAQTVFRCMRKQPEERFQTVDEMLVSLASRARTPVTTARATSALYARRGLPLGDESAGAR